MSQALMDYETLDVDQIDQSTDRSYSITGYCTNPSGCTVSVTQN